MLGAQNLSRVIALPEPNVALVQMDTIAGKSPLSSTGFKRIFCWGFYFIMLIFSLLDQDKPM